MGLSEAPVLDPKGPITRLQRDLLFTALGLMLIVAIPVFVMTFCFAWRYRASNRRAAYAPDWSYSTKIDAVVWLVPALIVLTLGALVWRYSHTLEPVPGDRRRPEPPAGPGRGAGLEVAVPVPEQNIAVVNQLVFPSQTPLSLQISSDTVMNSFIIPALGGQIYAMAGMQSRLHLVADEPGRFVGRNTQYSGDGFADQQFEAIAAAQADFDAWVAKVRQSQQTLDGAAYEELARPSERHPVTYYGAFEPDLFDRIIAKYANGGMDSAPECQVGRRHVLGKLTIDALPLYSWVAMGGAAVTVLGGLAVMALLSWFGQWRYFWREWLTSLDHKRIGIMYATLALIMLLRGFVDALMMRAQQAVALNSDGYLPPDHSTRSSARTAPS